MKTKLNRRRYVYFFSGKKMVNETVLSTDVSKLPIQLRVLNIK